MAKIFKPFEIFLAKICVITSTIPANSIKYSTANVPVLFVIMKNQNDSPAVTASDLNLGDDVCMLNRVYEGDQA